MCAISTHFSQTKEKCTRGQHHWASLAAVLSTPAREGRTGQALQQARNGASFSPAMSLLSTFLWSHSCAVRHTAPSATICFPSCRQGRFYGSIPVWSHSAFAKAPNRLRVRGLVPCSCSVLGVGSAAAGAHGEEPLCISSASASSRLMWVEAY